MLPAAFTVIILCIALAAGGLWFHHRLQRVEERQTDPEGVMWRLTDLAERVDQLERPIPAPASR